MLACEFVYVSASKRYMISTCYSFNPFSVKARGGNVSEGVDANLECKLTPEPEESEASIIWKKDGIPLDQIPSLKDRISFDPANATLTINAASKNENYSIGLLFFSLLLLTITRVLYFRNNDYFNIQLHEGLIF